MRVPTIGEAFQLAQTYDIPAVGEGELFWTDEIDRDAGGVSRVYAVRGSSGLAAGRRQQVHGYARDAVRDNADQLSSIRLQRTKGGPQLGGE
jgi:hypothetical protein